MSLIFNTYSVSKESSAFNAFVVFMIAGEKNGEVLSTLLRQPLKNHQVRRWRGHNADN